MKRLLLFLSVVTLVQSQICQNVSSTGYVGNCYVDLTVAIDMSTAMVSTSNIIALDNSLLQNYFVNYYQETTRTAVIVFGTQYNFISNYSSDYNYLCNFIQNGENQTINSGIYATNLSSVLTAYRNQLLYSGRNYQKVLVVFTAITDSSNIYNAINISKEIRNAGAQIIVVALNSGGSSTAAYSTLSPTTLTPFFSTQTWSYTTYRSFRKSRIIKNRADASDLGMIADQVIYLPSYTVDSVNAQIIAKATCIHAGVTATSNYPTTTFTPPNPLSNSLGRSCSNNTKNLWLDILLLFDVSNSMVKSDLRQFPFQLLTIFGDFTIGQSPKHSTRIGVLAYYSDVTVMLDLNNNTDFNDLQKVLISLQNEYKPNDSGGNILGALRGAQNIFQNQKSYRAKTIVLTAAAYDPLSFGNPEQTAQDLKNDGISIITIAYDGVGGIAPDLGNLSSPGYSYKSSEQDLIGAVNIALTQTNCFCPSRTLQFQIYNGNTQRFTTYADCLNLYSGDTDPVYGPFVCTPGVLASVTSSEKLNFILDHVLITGIKNITVGAYYDNSWKWYNYNDTSYPIGNYPTIPSSSNGLYGYFYNSKGFNWNFGVNSGGAAYAIPYVCQYRACDADYFCDQTNSKATINQRQKH